MCAARRPAARAHAHEALVFRMSALDALRADVARLALGVLRARRDRDLRRLVIFLVRVVLLGAAAFFNLLAKVLVAAFVPMLGLAGWSTVARFAATALLGAGRQRRGAAVTHSSDHPAPISQVALRYGADGE